VPVYFPVATYPSAAATSTPPATITAYPAVLAVSVPITSDPTTMMVPISDADPSTISLPVPMDEAMNYYNNNEELVNSVTYYDTANGELCALGLVYVSYQEQEPVMPEDTMDVADAMTLIAQMSSASLADGDDGDGYGEE